MSAVAIPTKVEPREFTFHWRENGETRWKRIQAESYADACWMLGAIHFARFAKSGVPKDFDIDLVSQEPGR